MKTRSNLRSYVLWLGFGMGLTLLILGILTGIVLLISPETIASFAVQPIATFTSAAPASPTPTNTVPTATPEPSPTPPVPTLAPTPVVTTYTVIAGDTLYSIAFEYGTTAEAIIAANPDLISPDNIQPGQVFIIPDSIPVTTITPSSSTSDETITHHTVISGETLSDIAYRYDVSVEAIKLANGLPSDFIQAGSDLVIPVEGIAIQQPTPGTVGLAWQPSVIEGDVDTFYSQVTDAERFTLHYQPNSLPAQDIVTVLEMITTALTHIEKTLDVHLDGRFDAYAAGSLFRAPNLALRGRSFSSHHRFFFLYDGTGTPADQQYILTHELTHVTTWNTMGRPVSVMLHEGVAVYTGMELVEDSGYIPLGLFCAAYHSIGQLPSMSASPTFEGHIRDLDSYYTAGCFVQFLIERYGTDSFAEVYHTGDYYGVYGKDIADLEAEWIADIQAANYSIPFDPNELVHYVGEVATAYDRLFGGFEGTESQMAAYEELDRARMALLQGHLHDTANHLLVFNDLLSQ